MIYRMLISGYIASVNEFAVEFHLLASESPQMLEVMLLVSCSTVECCSEYRMYGWRCASAFVDAWCIYGVYRIYTYIGYVLCIP
jgi:hypothetical protein